MIDRVRVALIHWLGGLTPQEVGAERRELARKLDHMQWAARRVLESREPLGPPHEHRMSIKCLALKALAKAHYETTGQQP